MKQVSEMPTSGQFVAVYQIDGNNFISIERLAWVRGILHAQLELYDKENDVDYFALDEANPKNYTHHHAQYFIVD